MKSSITFNDFDLIKAFQNLSVSSPAPVTIVYPSGDITTIKTEARLMDYLGLVFGLRV